MRARYTQRKVVGAAYGWAATLCIKKSGCDTADVRYVCGDCTVVLDWEAKANPRYGTCKGYCEAQHGMECDDASVSEKFCSNVPFGARPIGCTSEVVGIDKYKCQCKPAAPTTTMTTTKLACSCGADTEPTIAYDMGKSTWEPKHWEVMYLEHAAGSEVQRGFDYAKCITTTTTTTTSTITTSTTSTTLSISVDYSKGCPAPPLQIGSAYTMILVNTWSLACAPGYALDNSGAGNLFTCEVLPEGNIRYDGPGCQVSNLACSTASITDHTKDVGGSAVTGTTCMDATVPVGSTCQATCAQNVSSSGIVQCVARDGVALLDGWSFCIAAGSTSTAQEANVVKGFMAAVFSITPSTDQLKSAVFAMFQPTSITKEMVTEVVFQVRGRRLIYAAGELIDLNLLSHEQHGRLLSSGTTFNVNYTISIPTSQSVDIAQVLLLAESVGEVNSTAAEVFVKILKSSFIDVSNVEKTSSTTIVQDVVLVDANGKVVSPNPTNSPPSKEPSGTTSGNIGMVIGGLFGGVAVCVIIGAIVYYTLLKRKKAEA